MLKICIYSEYLRFDSRCNAPRVLGDVLAMIGFLTKDGGRGFSLMPSFGVANS